MISEKAMRRRRTYDVWRQMLKRCEDPSRHDYERYGGRGIRVCPEWHSFEQFLSDMGLKPDGYSIDRERVNDGYQPNNCQWIPMERQASTRRNSKRRQDSTPEILRLRASGWSQERIAEAVGIHQTTVARVLESHGMRARVNDGRSWRPAC